MPRLIPADFYPRPPRGGRPAEEGGRYYNSIFLSTPSARRATCCENKQLIGDLFLSTPSARRATKEIYAQGSAADISIHALREEGDSRTSRSTSQKRNFYPRPPRGGRRSLVSASNVTFRFLSTPSARRATKSPLAGFPHQRDFYPRPPRGGRRIMDCAGITKRGFLSTPSARRATIVQATSIG